MKSKQNIFKYHYRQLKYLPVYDYYPYIWYRGHRLLFQSLIFKGRKLWAFNFLGDLKYELKIRESIDPFWSFLIGLMKIMPLLFYFLSVYLGYTGCSVTYNWAKTIYFCHKWVVKLTRTNFALFRWVRSWIH
jgi:hypothetical protein